MHIYSKQKQKAKKGKHGMRGKEYKPSSVTLAIYFE